MNPNAPIGPNREFKEESLKKKFSYSFTRGECIVLVGFLRQIQLPLQDGRIEILLPVLREIEKTAIQSITSDDYKPEETPTNTPDNNIAVN